MRSFAGCLLHAFAAPAFVLLIDEPEVFLHPPHAKLLGKILANTNLANRQTVIATHSSDLLRGVLDSTGRKLQIVRMTRIGGKNHAHELLSESVRKVWDDPLLRHSNVLDGLFHDLVVVCEADADCRFYSAILESLKSDTEKSEDVLFTWSNGKHRLKIVVAALKQLGVTTRVVADFDILQDENPLANIVDTLGGDWDSLRGDWAFVKGSIEGRLPKPSPSELSRDIQAILQKESGSAISEKVADAIRDKLKFTSPWKLAKVSGTAGVPSGQPTERLKKLIASLKLLGIFVVECGELERFVTSIGGHGPGWVSEVLANRNVKLDPELEMARRFVESIVAPTPQSSREISSPSSTSQVPGTTQPSLEQTPTKEAGHTTAPSEPAKTPKSFLSRIFG